jgi:hypothetical protein
MFSIRQLEFDDTLYRQILGRLLWKTIEAELLEKFVDGTIAQSSRDLAAAEIVALKLDEKVLQRLKSIVNSNHAEPRAMEFTLPPQLGSALLGLGDLGHLQEWRKGLASKADALLADLKDLDLLQCIGRNGRLAPQFAKLFYFSAESCELIDGDVLSPSLHPPWSDASYFECVHEEFYAIIDRKRAQVRKTLFLCRAQSRYITAKIARLLRLALLPLGLFCSVRWEERRWFLVHGACPPKAAQAMLSLLSAACSGPLVAY